MTISPVERTIFKRGSRTYYWSSLFFPKSIRNDIFRLYSFVRVADNYVDQIPADVESFRELQACYTQLYDKTFDDWEVLPSDDVLVRVVKNMCYVAHTYGFERSWIDDFLAAMESDLHHTPPQTLDESLHYVYGSAEVIGLMMARILGVSESAHEAAMVQGRAMQWINFIRDINEDNDLGRLYFPTNEIYNAGLTDLTKASALANPQAFHTFVTTQLDHYAVWQQAAQQGAHAIPRRSRIAVRIAADGYAWTARAIRKHPERIYSLKLRPSKIRLLAYAARRIITG